MSSLQECKRQLAAALIVAAAIAVVSTSQPAAAQNQSDCGFYFANDPSIPETVRVRLAAEHDVAAQVCNPGTENMSYFSVSEVRKGNLGTCIFQVAPPTGRFAYDTRETLMSVPQRDCPKQSDPVYVQTQGVSEGVFISAAAFVRRILGSRRSFDAALLQSGLNPRDQDYEAIRADIASSEVNTRLKWRSIMLWPASSSFDQISALTPDLAYQIDFTIGDRQNFGWSLTVDLTPNGLRLLHVGFWALSHPAAIIHF